MVRIEIPEALLNRYEDKCNMVHSVMEALVNTDEFDFGDTTEILILGIDTSDAFMIAHGDKEDKGKYMLRINFMDKDNDEFIQIVATAVTQLMCVIHQENNIEMPISFYFQLSSVLTTLLIDDKNNRINMFFAEIKTRYTMEEVSDYINTIVDNLNKNAIVPLNKDDYDEAKLFMDTIRTFALKYTL